MTRPRSLSGSQVRILQASMPFSSLHHPCRRSQITISSIGLRWQLLNIPLLSNCPKVCVNPFQRSLSSCDLRAKLHSSGLGTRTSFQPSINVKSWLRRLTHSSDRLDVPLSNSRCRFNRRSNYHSSSCSRKKEHRKIRGRPKLKL